MPGRQFDHAGVILATWFEWRSSFRHFRSNRLWSRDPLEDLVKRQGSVFGPLWEDVEKIVINAQEKVDARQSDT